MSLALAILLGLGTSAPKTYVEDVFSAYTYTGNGSSQTITNGIDLAGKGGLVWFKGRGGQAHRLFDTARGVGKYINSNDTNVEATAADSLTTFNSGGFSVGADTSTFGVNGPSTNYVAWAFRKAAKFFDVVTYTGTGAARTISHNLGVAPGLIIIKSRSNVYDWTVYHTSLGAGQYAYLNSTDIANSSTLTWNNTSPTSSAFSIGSNTDVNANGETYVAYLFAHDTGTDGMIQCGSYTGTSSSPGPNVTLGWEPQFVMVKRATGATGNWMMFDASRGMLADGTGPVLYANSTNAEASAVAVIPNATGFSIATSGGVLNGGGNTYIYMAIRRPMKTPTVGTEVFNTVASGGPSSIKILKSDIGFDADCVLRMDRSATSGASYNQIFDRVRGFVGTGGAAASSPGLKPSSTAAETTSASYLTPDGAGGFDMGSSLVGYNILSYLFRRAPGFFDVVGYTGSGSSGTVQHGLGVAPELIFLKQRAGSGWWRVSGKDIATGGMYLHLTNAASGASPQNPVTTTTFSVGGTGDDGASSSPYIAYLFASCPGVSKIGTYTGNGTSQTINCGFTAGARFILIKRIDSAGDWYVWDTVRGIVSANDPHLSLNTGAAEVTSDDSIDPDSSGFIVNQVAATNINVNAATYLYLAIA